MREGIHPDYREVCFVDLSNGFKFVTRSCVNTKETVKMDDGRELPLFKLDTTSESHPFYTGTQKSVTTASLPDTAQLKAKKLSSRLTVDEANQKLKELLTKETEERHRGEHALFLSDDPLDFGGDDAAYR